MRNELFAQIKKNRKQYYRELRNQKATNLQKQEPVAETVSFKNLKNDKPISATGPNKNEKKSQPDSSNKFIDELKLKAGEVSNGLIKHLGNGFRDVSSKLPGNIKKEFKLASNQIQQTMNPVILKLRNEYEKISFAIGGRMQLVSNYAIDNINNLGTVIFDVEDEPQSATQRRVSSVEMSENPDISEWFSKVLVILPEKIKRALTNLLIYLESDLLVFKTNKKQKDDWNQKTIAFKPLQHKIKTLKLFSVSKEKVDADNTLKDNCIENNPPVSQDSISISASKYFRTLKSRYLLPMINKFLK